jgi:hypothetical protein
MPALRRSISIAVVFLSTVLIASMTVSADDASKNVGDGSKENPFIVPAAAKPVKIDGVLDEEAWGTALVLGIDYEIQPGENIAPPVKTDVLITFDKSNLYVAFRCFDPEPASIRAHLTDRERCLDDDHVNFHIDTFNDERRHFTIGANPLGVQMDAIYNNGSYDWSWDAIFDSAGKIHDFGWVVELAVPFNQLRFQRTGGPQVWGFDAWRIYSRSTFHYLAVVPSDRNNNCRPCQMLKIKGFDGVTPGRNIEINPTVTAVRTDAREQFPAGDFSPLNKQAEVGLTASWGVTPNITVSGTINPDFSQVEADARQLDINQPFALYYSEKRPFFLEGGDFFASPMIEAVYTRTLRDPVWGTKVAGKEGANSLAAFFVQDDFTNLLFPALEYSQAASLPFESSSAVFRYKRDIGNKYTLGALMTNRQGDGYYNRVFGFDGDFRITDKDRVRAQVLGSSTRYPADIIADFNQPDGNFGDRAFEVSYNHSTRTYYWWARVEDYGRDFRADLGYVPQVDYRMFSGCFGRQWVPEESSWFNNLDINTSYQYAVDQDGNRIRSRGDLFFLYEGPMQSVAAARYFKQLRFYNGEDFNMTYFGTYTGFTPSKYIFAGLDTSFGDNLDYANTRKGGRIRLYPELTLRLGGHLSVYFGHEFERMKIGAERLYTANVSQSTVVYQFNTRTFLRTIFQYVDYDYNVDLYTFEIDPEFKQLFTQILFSYKINPRTVLFLGYSDNYYGAYEYGLTQSDRTFFMKIGYAWQL